MSAPSQHTTTIGQGGTIRDLFRNIDSNHSGVIATSELADALRPLHLHLTPGQELRSILRSTDYHPTTLHMQRSTLL